MDADVVVVVEVDDGGGGWWVVVVIFVSRSLPLLLLSFGPPSQSVSQSLHRESVGRHRHRHRQAV